MGVFVQQASTKASNIGKSYRVPSHIRGVLHEFLRRYNELQILRHREVAWMMVVILTSSLLLWSMLFIKSLAFAIPVNGLLILGFALTLRKYFQVRKVSQHEYINVHILYHHLLGKLEVGFCEHEVPCQCSEDFRKYMWQRYRISFYGNSI